MLPRVHRSSLFRRAIGASRADSDLGDLRDSRWGRFKCQGDTHDDEDDDVDDDDDDDDDDDEDDDDDDDDDGDGDDDGGGDDDDDDDDDDFFDVDDDDSGSTHVSCVRRSHYVIVLCCSCKPFVRASPGWWRCRRPSRTRRPPGYTRKYRSWRFYAWARLFNPFTPNVKRYILPTF